jgi:hypothetical protein
MWYSQTRDRDAPYINLLIRQNRCSQTCDPLSNRHHHQQVEEYYYIWCISYTLIKLNSTKDFSQYASYPHQQSTRTCSYNQLAHTFSCPRRFVKPFTKINLRLFHLYNYKYK